jgi:hypothetical protein
MSIDSFNRFFSSINVEEPNNEDLNMILKNYNDYVHKITFTNNETYLLDILSKKNELNIIETILNNIEIVDKYYKKFYDIKDKDYKKTDEFIDTIYLYNKCLSHALIIIYQYFIFIYEIIPSIEPCGTIAIDIECLSSFFNAFIRNENNSSVIHKDEILKQKIINSSTSNIDATNILLIIYKITLIRFNELFFSMSIDYPIRFYNIGSRIKGILETKLETFRREEGIKSLYYKIAELLDSNIEINILHRSHIHMNKYITIPQYDGYCWFVSFLTGLTYSDKNKALLLRIRQEKGEELEKLIKNLSDINDKTEIKIILISFVYYIIDNITLQHKKYTSKMSSNCEIFKYLMKIPLLFLNKLIGDYKQKFTTFLISSLIKKIEEPLTKRQRINDKINDKIIEQIMEQQIQKNLNENTINPNNYIYRSILNNNSFGLNNDDIIIIKKFYEFLNINCLFIYKLGDDIYANMEDLKKDDNFDVIFISQQQKNFQIKGPQNCNYIKIDGRIHQLEINSDKRNIIFKKVEYELDYIMIITDNDSLCDKNCGHCICALHYNNKEYYHDSGYTINEFTCDGISDRIKLPCSLIKKNWTSTLDDPNNNFCIIPCTLIKNYIPNDVLFENEISAKFSNNLCFNNSKIKYCYVRKIPTSGGKGERKNNNKNLMRKVYLDKKLNKYYINYENKRIYLSK